MTRRWKTVARIIADLSIEHMPDDKVSVVFMAGCGWGDEDWPGITLADLKTLARAALAMAERGDKQRTDSGRYSLTNDPTTTTP